MEFATLILLAVGLSMDAFAVSVSNGLCYNGLKRTDVLKIAGTFGLFQAAMPLIGYYLGQTFSRSISAADHWIALILLSGIGIHMIIEAARNIRKPDTDCALRTCTLRSLLAQGIATSIDALAVGISFALLQINIFAAVLFIGCVTFIVSAAGVILGKKIGAGISSKAEIIGGLILIGIGLKIFMQHIFS